MRQRVDVVVVGAGFAGLRALYTLRESLGYSVALLEANAGIGGVWYSNQYPGARCDVESYDYSYMFSAELEQEWRWSERYATQPEVLRYINYTADKFDLRKNIWLNRKVSRAAYDERAACWSVEAETGEQWRARYLIMAVGQLSKTKAPVFEGQEQFQGEVYHSGEWPHEPVDFSGKRVGIIGTGSSGVQMTPVVAELADHLTVFQRTANFSIPAAHRKISDEEDAQIKAHYRERRQTALNSPTGLGFVPNKQSALDVPAEERRRKYEDAWEKLGFGFALAYYDILLDEAANETAAEFVREKIAKKVDDPVTREKLTPRGFPLATKRPSVDDGYFEAFNRDNVTLVDVREKPIREITATGIRTGDEHHELDILVFATGFDAFTGSLLNPDILGRGGQSLRDKWSAGPATYLGLGVSGFPNFFILAGPGSPSLLSNVLVSIEQHVDWLGEFLKFLEDNNFKEVEADRSAEKSWIAHVNKRSKETLYPKAESYYMGDEVPGKPHVFMAYSGGVRGYRRILDEVAAKGYEGFAMRRLNQPARATTS